MDGARLLPSRLVRTLAPPCPVSSGQTILFCAMRRANRSKFRRMALRKGHAGRASYLFFAGRKQFAECPAFGGSDIAQRRFIAPFCRNLPPPFVKHCQFGSAPLTSDASELMILAKTNLSETNGRRFEFARDSFAFANELVWEYQMDAATGKRTLSSCDPKPEYAHRCFALARVARQFFYHARFAADRPVATDEIYQQLVRAVIARHPRIASKPDEQIIIPGFASLREFSGRRKIF